MCKKVVGQAENIMGIEYILRTGHSDCAEVHLALSRLYGAVVVVAKAHTIEFRDDSSHAASMADAVAQVEVVLVYFLDNGGKGRAFLGTVVAVLCSLGPLTVEEL